MNKAFIHTNNKQRIGALVAKFAIEKYTNEIPVEFINVDELEVFKNFAGKSYLFAGKVRTYNPLDLQSFTLSRFMAPELMNYEGKAVVIDPDVFALNDISELFNFPLQDNAIACCRKKNAWDTSVMLMECSKLKHWKMEDILKRLSNKETDYTEIMSLKNEDHVTELPRIWNNLDTLTPGTKMIHMTGRLTQPWKTGLPIDFTRNPMPKIFGIIPREPIHKILGKYETHYQPHPNKEIDNLFFSLSKEALDAGTITEEQIKKEVEAGYIRPDFLERVRS